MSCGIGYIVAGISTVMTPDEVPDGIDVPFWLLAVFSSKSRSVYEVKKSKSILS
jgi:hypothetical protein